MVEKSAETHLIVLVVDTLNLKPMGSYITSMMTQNRKSVSIIQTKITPCAYYKLIACLYAERWEER